MSIRWKRGTRLCDECGQIVGATWVSCQGWTPDPHKAPDGLPCEGMKMEQAEKDKKKRRRGAVSLKFSQNKS